MIRRATEKEIPQMGELPCESGCYNLTLNDRSCNERAMRFYESCGLVPQKSGMELIL